MGYVSIGTAFQYQQSDNDQGAERGKMGTHLWDINVLDSISIDFMGVGDKAQM